MPEKLRHGEPINVLLFNDVGFQYGAGIALRRQAASFLLNGWNVRIAAWRPGNDTEKPLVTGVPDFDHWEGVVPLSKVTSRKHDDLNAVAAITGQLAEWKPDVIIAGNLHGTGLPLEILASLRGTGALLLAYMHDVFWATGRCAYPGACTMFQTGCKPTCPTPDEYPTLEPARIPAAWALRNKLFTGPNSIPMIANSQWTQEIVRKRYGSAARCEIVHLGLDHHLYAPISKPEARSLLGLPQKIPVIVMGAVDVNDQRKGGPLFRGVQQTLANRQDVGLILFGQWSERLRSTKSFGLVQDARFMPIILSAADILVNTAVEEAFGQTLLEAAACGLPAVTFNVGGVSDIVVHEQTGLLVDDLAVEPMLAALESLIEDPSKRAAFGQRARARVEDQFTLTRQARAWVDCIRGVLC
ncbi:MAG: glycosyltransferase [Terriglobales bacterium]